MKRVVIWILAAVLVMGGLIFFVMNLEPERRRPVSLSPRATEHGTEKGPRLAELPVESWTPHIIALQRAGEWLQLAAELAELREGDPQRYTAWDLGYLEARALGEGEEYEQARSRLEPWLAEDNPFRPTALYHASRFAALAGDEEEASALRRIVIEQGARNPWWRDAIAEEVGWLVENADAGELETFAASIRSSAPSDLRRELDAARVARRVSAGQIEQAWAIAMPLFRGGVGDDAADRAARALDGTTGDEGITAERIRILGEVAQSHRRYDRAVALLARAREAAPADRADLTFSIGRSQFGAEEFDDAEATYLAGARIAAKPEERATFFFHASRAAQLLGDDDRALQHMNAAIASANSGSALSAALTQRMRTHMHRGEWNAARRDLATHASRFPTSETRVETLTHLAVGRLLAGDPAEAERLLASTPTRLIDDHSRTEIDYWRGRAAEATDPAAALDRYRSVLRSDYPTHYTYFAQERLRQESIAKLVAARVAELDEAIAAATEGEKWDDARRNLTERWELTRDPAALERLREVYRKLPVHSRIVDLEPRPLPGLGSTPPGAGPGYKAMAMGLYDDALLAIPEIYPATELDAALSQALALGRAGAGRESVLAVEILMRRVPDDYVTEALPRIVLELLYPRYYWNAIVEQAGAHDADPRLVISIMREESRFNPRAKSAAAARGLLQFIITTARSVGQSIGIVELQPDDLYDPDVIIRLGARYVGDLLDEFDGNAYRAAAAYNAGPQQTKLWGRLLPSQDDDVFLTFVNFTETKHYVRKVLNSYERYEYLYGAADDMDSSTGRE